MRSPQHSKSVCKISSIQTPSRSGETQNLVETNRSGSGLPKQGQTTTTPLQRSFSISGVSPFDEIAFATASSFGVVFRC